MPNWVTNNVLLKGSEADLMNFIDFLKQGNRKELDFNVFISVPKRLEIDAPTGLHELAVGEFLVDHTLTLLNQEERFTHKVLKDYLKDKFHISGDNGEEVIKQYIEAREKSLAAGFDSFTTYCMDAYRNLKTYGYANWYDFCLDKWGTKWNAAEATPLNELEPYFEDRDGVWCLEFSFATAWSTPIGIIENLAKRFPSLQGCVEFASEDYGNDCGCVEISKGGKLDIHLLDNGSLEAYEHSLAVCGNEELLEYLEKDEEGQYYIDYEAM